jgi:hypothetical protein
VKLSELSPISAEELVGKTIKVQHVKTSETFNVVVVDCCFEDQKGIIFHFADYSGSLCLKNLRKSLDDLQTLDVDSEDRRNRPIGVDARDIFDGDKFQLVG